MVHKKVEQALQRLRVDGLELRGRCHDGERHGPFNTIPANQVVQYLALIWWKRFIGEGQPRRSGRTNERISSVMSFGSSAAPKCPPLGNTVHWRRSL
jgi:hypothetical protein